MITELEIYIAARKSCVDQFYIIKLHFKQMSNKSCGYRLRILMALSNFFVWNGGNIYIYLCYVWFILENWKMEN